jgi:hypothetical protein
MILKASHNPVIYPFFQIYSLWKIRRNFHKVFISGEFREKDLPVLLISNHISWWDGFWVEYLNIKLFHRKFYFMMLEEQLKKNIFLNKTGGYSVRKWSRSLIESLDYTSELLKNKKNLVLMFPQGKIESIHNQNITFERGIEYVLKKVEGKVQIFFLVNLIDYFSNPRSGLYMYFREYKGTDFSSETLQKEFNCFHTACISENIGKGDP